MNHLCFATFNVPTGWTLRIHDQLNSLTTGHPASSYLYQTHQLSYFYLWLNLFSWCFYWHSMLFGSLWGNVSVGLSTIVRIIWICPCWMVLQLYIVSTRMSCLRWQILSGLLSAYISSSGSPCKLDTLLWPTDVGCGEVHIQCHLPLSSGATNDASTETFIWVVRL